MIIINIFVWFDWRQGGGFSGLGSLHDVCGGSHGLCSRWDKLIITAYYYNHWILLFFSPRKLTINNSTNPN